MRDVRGSVAALAACALLLVLPLSADAQRVYEDVIAAVNNDRAAELATLLARGVDPNTVDPGGDPLLFIAARSVYKASTDALLAAKANINAKNRHGDTPIMTAALNGHLDIVRKLRSQGADLEPSGWTPLIYAATGGHDAIVTYLLDQGANINARSPNGTTALMMAVREGHGSTMELLLKRGADVNRRNDNGASALDWARAGNDSAMVEKLRRAGAGR